MSNFHSNNDTLRAEIAAAAARMIAEDGADYGSAKRKAAKLIVGDSRPASDILPNNAQIEEEVRAYNALFLSETQPARLLQLRKLALVLMDEFAHFSPYLTGAVLNGTAGEHSDIHLQLFPESAKEVEIYLINKKINFEVSEDTQSRGRNEPVETLSFMWNKEGVHLSIYDSADSRFLSRNNAEGRPERANADTIRVLIGDQT